MSSQASRRVNEQLKSYWETVSAGRDFPGESEISPDALKDIWDSCFMVRYDGEDDQGAPEFRYIYLGNALIEAYGDDLNDKEICEKLAYPNNNALSQQFLQVVQERRVVEVDAEFTNSKGMLIKYRSCLMPLAKDDPSHVGYVLGGMRWKAL